jgi:hypothetical protein
MRVLRVLRSAVEQTFVDLFAPSTQSNGLDYDIL